MSRPSEDPLTFRTLHDGPVVGVRESTAAPVAAGRRPRNTRTPITSSSCAAAPFASTSAGAA